MAETTATAYPLRVYLRAETWHEYAITEDDVGYIQEEGATEAMRAAVATEQQRLRQVFLSITRSLPT